VRDAYLFAQVGLDRSLRLVEFAAEAIPAAETRESCVIDPLGALSVRLRGQRSKVFDFNGLRGDLSSICEPSAGIGPPDT
jgi:hypothetical protein